MGYQVLARKWRPKNFAEVVGQQHVLKPLFNALQTGRLHHAWLLTGTRGVGKTTIARILAKSLNCEQGITAQPCGTCSACVAIDEGRFVDLLEIDAASRTKVEDTRELLDNVQYKPTQGRFKVYLIDEVHMLSRHSFNALLKTLEEPPEHVKFLLATTDPQKLPITVLSRCLQFNLKALSRDEISQHLQHILQQEQIPFEQSAILALARAAQGSIRDALSLTDQAISQGEQAVTEAGVQQMLGHVPSLQLVSILQQVLMGDAELMLQTLDRVASQVPDLSNLLTEMQNLIHQLALYQAVPASAEATGLEPAAQQLGQQLAPELIQIFYDILVQGRRDLNYAADVRAGVEMTLLRLMAFRPEYLEIVETPIEVTTQTKTVAVAPPQSLLQSESAPQPEPEPEAEFEPEFEPEPTQEFEPEPAQDFKDRQAVEAHGPNEDDVKENDLQALLATRNALQQKKNSEIEVEPAPEPPAPSSIEQPPEPSSTAAVEAQQEPVIQTEMNDETQRAAEVDRWSALIDALDLHGLTRQLARNSVLQKNTDDYVLVVRKNWAYLLNDGAIATIKEAMATQFDMQLRDILVGDAKAATPVEIQQQINARRLAVAQQRLQDDPIAQQLEQTFGARLQQDSVKPD